MSILIVKKEEDFQMDYIDPKHHTKSYLNFFVLNNACTLCNIHRLT